MTKAKNQLWFFDPDADYAQKHIVIVGVGWVGSVSAYYLTQMGCQNVTIIDMDDVEIHNTASQFYKQADLWQPKTEALKENILMFNGIEVKNFNEPYKKEMLEWADIVLCAVDNMDLRKEIVEDAFDLDVEFVVETRMSWENFRIYAFYPFTQLQRWMDERYPQSEVEAEICTEKSISYNTAMIGSFVTKIIKDYLRENGVPFVISVEGILNVNYAI